MSRGKQYTSKGRDEVIRSLEPYLCLGLSVSHACKLAQFPSSTMHDWLKQDEVLRTKVVSWQSQVTVEARRVIVQQIKDGDVKMSKWWLERRDKDFQPTSQLNFNTEQDRAIQETLDVISDLANKCQDSV